jgi:hypothetical protein
MRQAGQHRAVFLMVLLLHPEDGDSIFLRNNGEILPDYGALHRGR